MGQNVQSSNFKLAICCVGCQGWSILRSLGPRVPDSEVERLEALQSNNASDLFEFFFREQARLAFLNRGVSHA